MEADISCIAVAACCVCWLCWSMRRWIWSEAERMDCALPVSEPAVLTTVPMMELRLDCIFCMAVARVPIWSLP